MQGQKSGRFAPENQSTNGEYIADTLTCLSEATAIIREVLVEQAATGISPKPMTVSVTTSEGGVITEDGN